MSNKSQTENLAHNRVGWLDSCKGFAIILVVIGHIMTGYSGSGLFPEQAELIERAYHIICSFHMPLFFCISGYVFYIAYLKDREAKRHRFRLQIMNNICIYVYMSCVFWLTKSAAGVFGVSLNTSIKLRDLLLIPINPLDVYWYLYVLIFIYVIVYNIFGRIKNEKNSFVLFGVISIAGSCITVYLVCSIKKIMFYSIFFLIGVLISKHEGYKPKKIFYAVIFIGAAAALFCAGYFNVSVRDINVIGVFASAMISIGIIFLFKKLSFLSESSILSFFGRYSLEIYLIHNIIVGFAKNVLIKIGITNLLLNMLMSFFLAAFIPIGFSFLLKKLNLHKPLFRPANYFSDKKAEQLLNKN